MVNPSVCCHCTWHLKEPRTSVSVITSQREASWFEMQTYWTAPLPLEQRLRTSTQPTLKLSFFRGTLPSPTHLGKEWSQDSLRIAKWPREVLFFTCSGFISCPWLLPTSDFSAFPVFLFCWWPRTLLSEEPTQQMFCPWHWWCCHDFQRVLNKELHGLVLLKARLT